MEQEQGVYREIVRFVNKTMEYVVLDDASARKVVKKRLLYFRKVNSWKRIIEQPLWNMLKSHISLISFPLNM